MRRNELVTHLVTAIFAFFLFWGVAAIYRKLRGREGLGFGDAKLMAGIGAWVGPTRPAMGDTYCQFDRIGRSICRSLNPRQNELVERANSIRKPSLSFCMGSVVGWLCRKVLTTRVLRKMNPRESSVSIIQTFGRLLIERDKLTERDLERVVRLNRETGEKAHVIVVKLGLVTETDAAQALAESLGLALANEEDYPSGPIFDGRLSARFLKEHRIMPLHGGDDGILLAMADPMDRYAIHAVELSTGNR